MANKKEKSLTRKQVVIAIIALLEIFILFITFTYSWIPDGRVTEVDSSTNFSVTADSGVRIDFGGDYSGKVEIENVDLHECSSIDGRNVFFPTTGSGMNVDTASMKFRESNASDIDRKYIAKTFTIQADVGATNVWLDKESFVNFKGTKNPATAIRIAFYENDGNKPIVFSPELGTSQIKKCNAINSIKKDGTPILNEQSSISFKEYIYGNSNENILFSLEANEKKTITLFIWLEGTDPDCTHAIMGSKDLDINIKFSSTWEETGLFRLIDETGSHWLGNDGAEIVLTDTDTGIQYKMEKAEDFDKTFTWTCRAPKTIESANFYRLNPNTGEAWNSWKTNPLRKGSYTYLAKDSGYGEWRYNPEDMDGDEEPTTTVPATTDETGLPPLDSDKLRIFFTDVYNWKSADGIYLFFGGVSGPNWPGTVMKSYGKDNNGHEMYWLDVPIGINLLEIGDGQASSSKVIRITDGSHIKSQGYKPKNVHGGQGYETFPFP